MKALKVILLIVAVVIAAVVILAGAGLYFANRYVQSAAFKARVLATAHEELGSDVRIDDLRASLFSGAALQGVTIANPTNFPGNLVTANAFVLRYRLWPLLRRRVEIEQLSLDRPVIVLARNDRGQWNYEEFGAKRGEPKPAPAASEPATASAQATVEAAPFDVVLSRLAITRGVVSLVDENNKPLLKLDGIDFSSSVRFADGQLTGLGRATLDDVAVAGSLFVRKLAAPVSAATNQITLAPLSGTIANGVVTGAATVALMPTLRYAVNLRVQDGDMAKLLAEANVRPVINGKLELTASLEGTGGLATVAGSGHAEIRGGQLMEIPALNLVASLLQIDALRDLKFSECRVEFLITNNVLQTPVIRLTAPDVQIVGNGSVSLDDYSLNHNLTISFARGTLDRVPKEVRNLFSSRPDGSLALDFRVWGPYSAPKTDLQERVVKGVAEQLIQKRLQKFLK
jgi:uncharacterized protein involved in outer membrane biogenesis